MRPRADLAIAPLYLVVLLLCTALIVPVATTWVRSDADAMVGTRVWSGQILAVYFVAWCRTRTG
ncbi:hypothetical protein ACFQFC_36135 [Amorphoplanes digitatis]|uniref:Uncharacterized protein n=1 Tax=Actinoplanes digitatis TaxID=1868 RepID=A0A7W7HVN0_9ACTN|nr:hypothetical protein [Actinoplanes digitatis]MBB4761590.1 hypothetical protein [Actinoplanes digitatis]BFE70143.1 hypothetical protein GCM10020092_034440 [Actinoplanes digitatis]GID90699.1 hypothetical protein Adi01nite_01110 [Actinoplanes digitatis]